MGLRHISAAANHLVDHSQSLCKLIITPYVHATHTYWHTHHLTVVLMHVSYSFLHVHLVPEPIGSLFKERDVKSLIQGVFFYCIFAPPCTVHPVILYILACTCYSKTAVRLYFYKLNLSAGNNPFLFHLILFLVRNLQIV